MIQRTKMFWSLFFCLFLGIEANSDGQEVPTGFIVGGTDASIGEFPYQGFMLIEVEGGFSGCGCSLINSEWAITAAHCTNGRSADDMVAIFGFLNLNNVSTASVFNIREIKQNPTYSTDDLAVNKGDISLLRLDGKVEMTEFIQPIALPELGEEPKVNESCAITGWGATAEGEGVSPTLMKATVPVISNDECKNLYSNPCETIQFQIFPQELCAGFMEGGVDSCQGDSGGPLACMSSSGTPVLQGVTSFGCGCARKDFPGVYTRVSSYLDWINNAIAEDTTSTTTDISSNTTPFIVITRPSDSTTEATVSTTLGNQEMESTTDGAILHHNGFLSVLAVAILVFLTSS